MDTPAPSRTVTGRIDVHPRGFLIVQPSGSDEVLSAFIPPPELNPYLADDLVSATVTASEDGRWSASGLSLLRRPCLEVYGQHGPVELTLAG
jgi:ribonuclease R